MSSKPSHVSSPEPHYSSAQSYKSQEVLFYLCVSFVSLSIIYLYDSAPTACRHLTAVFLTICLRSMTHHLRIFTEGMKINCRCFQTSDYCEPPHSRLNQAFVSPSKSYYYSHTKRTTHKRSRPVLKVKSRPTDFRV